MVGGTATGTDSTVNPVAEVAELVPSDTTTLWTPPGTSGMVKVNSELPLASVVPPETMVASAAHRHVESVVGEEAVGIDGHPRRAHRSTLGSEVGRRGHGREVRRSDRSCAVTGGDDRGPLGSWAP